MKVHIHIFLNPDNQSPKDKLIKADNALKQVHRTVISVINRNLRLFSLKVFLA